MSMSPEDKLMAARCRLMIRESWYGHMAMSMSWRPTDTNWGNPDSATLGVRIAHDGIVCYWNPEWVEKIALERLFGAIEHVINHLIHMHALRQSGRDPQGWGIATDMVVNGKANNPRIGYKEQDSSITLPFPEMIFIPEDWPEDETAEFYYDKIMKGEGGDGKDGKGKSKGSGHGRGGTSKYTGDGDGGGANSKHTFQSGQFKGQAVDDHSIWSQTEVSEDEARQMINERARDATEKSQGHVPGHLKGAIDRLKKPVVRWREEVRIYLGSHVGNRRRTYSRVERRTQAFGSKGISHRASAAVSIIVDTSGSIGQKELEQFFGEIEQLASYCKLTLLQWDAAFGHYAKYRKGDWRNLTIHGGGGTDMAAPVKWLEERRLVGNVCIMLTDGYCNWPAPRNFPMLFCITTPEGATASPEWGKIIRMKLD